MPNFFCWRPYVTISKRQTLFFRWLLCEDEKLVSASLEQGPQELRNNHSSAVFAIFANISIFFFVAHIGGLSEG